MNMNPNYDCASRSFRDEVREKHRKTENEHAVLVMNFFKNKYPDPKSLHYDDLKLPAHSCGQRLIRITYDPTVINSNGDIEVLLVDWNNEITQYVKSKDKVVVYYSDVYFNAINLYHNISKMEFRKAQLDSGDYTAALRYFGSFTWHHGDLTSQVPFHGDKLP